MTAVSLVEAAYKRDRAIVVGGIVVLAALAWLYLIDTAGAMDGVKAVGGAGMADAITLKPWTLSHALMMFVMWAVMMVGMMVPTAAPMILLHARVWRKKLLDGQPYAPAGAFAAGYVVVWTLFSLAANAM